MDGRHQFRANWHDYKEGVYFVTVCCKNHLHYFGEISDGVMSLSAVGTIVQECIAAIPEHFDAEVWNSVVMPNHLHLVLAVNTSGASEAQHLGCLRPMKHGGTCDDFHHNCALATIVGSFKAAVTRAVRANNLFTAPVWQTRFHEHIIRNNHAYGRIMDYIDSNVATWDADCFYGLRER